MANTWKERRKEGGWIGERRKGRKKEGNERGKEGREGKKEEIKEEKKTISKY